MPEQQLYPGSIDREINLLLLDFVTCKGREKISRDHLFGIIRQSAGDEASENYVPYL
jgi:hypothetical protein